MDVFNLFFINSADSYVETRVYGRSFEVMVYILKRKCI